MTPLFSINFNKIALLRNSQGRDYPSEVTFAERATALGVCGLTLHPRPDQRHTRLVLDRYRQATILAKSLGLRVNAGHDLNLENLARFLTIEGSAEISIGHTVIVESLEWGFETVVRRYLDIVRQAA
jgi:pyridoxine 5'-phosphate synthase PdxJ